MKVTQNQLNVLCDAMLAAGSRIGSATLTVDRLRTAVEAGHPALSGQKFDTPSKAVLEASVSDAVGRYAQKLVLDGQEVKVMSDSLRTAERKDGAVYVVRNTKADMGNARPAVAWLHRLRSYMNAIRKDGERAVSSKVRESLVAEFGKLTVQEMRCLNVSDDSAGMGLSKAKSTVANMAAAESEAIAEFKARQAAASATNDSNAAVAKAKADAKAKTEASKGHGKRRPAAAKQIVQAAQAAAAMPIAA
jgi:hypothetical protein